MGRIKPTGITGKGVVLRPLTRADLPLLRDFVNEPGVMQYSNVYWPIDDLRQENWFEGVSKSHDSVWFGIEVEQKSGWVLVGTCCLVGIDWISRLAELRIRLGDPQVWGQGIGTEATRLLINYGFIDLNLERIWLRVYASNIRAFNLYKSIGFQQEGKLRAAAYIHGVIEDVFLMGLLRKEWDKSV